MRSTDPFASTDSAPLRHARAWLDPDTWQARLRSPLDAATLTALDDWIVRGRALVGRRGEARDDACHLGVVLPPSAGKRRVAIVVDRRAVVKVAPPLTLDEALERAPRDWRPALADLAHRGAAIGTSFWVYGSLAWQAIAGVSYVGPTSDVDLLWSADGDARIRRVLRLLVDWETRCRLRADGELLLVNGDGIAWRELLGDARRVLVKHRDHVSLQSSPLRPALDATPVRGLATRPT